MKITEVLTSSHTQAAVAEIVLINSALQAHQEGKPLTLQAAGIVLVTGLEIANLLQLKNDRYRHRSWEKVREQADQTPVTQETASAVFSAANLLASTDPTPHELVNYQMSIFYKKDRGGPPTNTTELFIKKAQALEELPDIRIKDKLSNEIVEFEIRRRTSSETSVYEIHRVTYSDKEVYNVLLGRSYIVHDAEKHLHPITETEGKRLLERLEPSRRTRLTRRINGPTG